MWCSFWMKKVCPFETRAIGKVPSTGRTPPAQPPFGRSLHFCASGSWAGAPPNRRSKRYTARSRGAEASKDADSTGSGGSGRVAEPLRRAASASSTQLRRTPAGAALRSRKVRGLSTSLSQNWSWFGLRCRIASLIAARHSSSTARAPAEARKKTTPVLSSESTCQRCLSQSRYCCTWSTDRTTSANASSDASCSTAPFSAGAERTDE
mmetsp:Transcript_20269/g.64771  ORF Transcript_20269/g.64771 Transcript_20269/m.64771 type:complete len:208 (-) Transcript_20269:558-1181(-)